MAAQDHDNFANWQSAGRRTMASNNADTIAKLAAKAGVDPGSSAFIVPSLYDEDDDEYLKSLSFQRGSIALVLLDILCPIFLLVHQLHTSQTLATASQADASALRLATLLTNGAVTVVHVVGFVSWLLSFAEHAVYLANSMKQRAVSYVRVLDAAVVVGGGIMLALRSSPALRLLTLLRLLRVLDLVNSLEAELRHRTLHMRMRFADAVNSAADLRAQLDQARIKWAAEAEARARTDEALQQLKEENEELLDVELLASEQVSQLQADLQATEAELLRVQEGGQHRSFSRIAPEEMTAVLDNDAAAGWYEPNTVITHASDARSRPDKPGSVVSESSHTEAGKGSRTGTSITSHGKAKSRLRVELNHDGTANVFPVAMRRR